MKNWLLLARLAMLALVAVLVLSSCSDVADATTPSYAKAEMLHRHGLSVEAKKELIDLITSGVASNADEAASYYLLGSIAFEENDLAVALSTWEVLVTQYPDSPSSALVRDRMGELAQIVGATTKHSIDNVIALSYLRHAEFWSDEKDEIFRIDSSWIPNVEAAVKWYDRVIDEFPGTPAARLAYIGKLRTLLGWKDPGQYGQPHGVRANFREYMPQVIDVFQVFETAFPEASALQGFRFQIAQAHWRNKDWGGTREWLQRIIEIDGVQDSFYGDLAKRRLLKVEY
jgi:tetratricopeptide (TPR) repeat protein